MILSASRRKRCLMRHRMPKVKRVPNGCGTRRAPSPSRRDRKSTRLNSSHGYISYAVFCLKTKKRTCFLLGSHPAVRQRVREEVGRVLGDRLPTSEDVPHLIATRMAIEGSLRLCPPVWSLA